MLSGSTSAVGAVENVMKSLGSAASVAAQDSSKSASERTYNMLANKAAIPMYPMFRAEVLIQQCVQKKTSLFSTIFLKHTL